jgi:hypothetical protein
VRTCGLNPDTKQRLERSYLELLQLRVRVRFWAQLSGWAQQAAARKVPSVHPHERVCALSGPLALSPPLCSLRTARLVPESEAIVPLPCLSTARGVAASQPCSAMRSVCAAAGSTARPAGISCTRLAHQRQSRGSTLQ